MAKISQRQIVAKVVYLPPDGSSAVLPEFTSNERKYFAQVSGGELQASVERVYDGGARFPNVLSSPSEISDLQLTRHYDPLIDEAPMSAFRDLIGSARFNVTVVTLTDDLAVQGSARIYPKALLTGMTEPEGDSSSGSAATYSLTFACEHVTPLTNFFG